MVVPAPPTFSSITTSSRTIRIDSDSPGGQLVALRSDSVPAAPPGSLVEAAELEQVGRALPGSGGAFSDAADGSPRWYQLALVLGKQALLGDVVEHPGFEDVSEVGVDPHGDRGALVRWRWPAGCTEALVAWRPMSPPTSIDDPMASRKKVTNTAYDIAGGWKLDELPRGQIHFLVRPAARADGLIITMPGCPDTARTSCNGRAVGELSYRLRRAGRRKRNLEIEILGSAKDRPDLYVVGRIGLTAPSSANDGAVLGTLASGTRSLAVPLDELELPLVVALFPAPGHESAVHIEHPVLEERTIS